MMNFKKVTFKQRGQAMVEYAILLILMVTLIMGGLELSVTAYNSKKTGDAAEAGANVWAEAISFSKANPTDPAQQSTETFEQLLEREREGLNIDTFLNEEDGGFSFDDNTYYNDRHCGSIPAPDTDSCTLIRDSAGHEIADLDPIISDPDDDEIRPFLPLGCTLTTIPTNYRINFNPSLPIDITACDQTQAGFEVNIRLLLSDANNVINFELFPLTENRELDPYQDFIEVCTSRANPDGIEKIVSCRALQDDKYTNRPTGGTDNFNSPTFESAIQNVCLASSPPCPDGLNDSPLLGTNGLPDDGVDNNDPTFRRLLILKELKNTEEYNAATSASTPTQQGVVVRRGLGNHTPTNFVRPTCNALGASASANDYVNGLPDTTSIYLFNPLPIDISNCNGNDPFRLNRTRMSILMDGYQDPAPTATVAAANNPAGDQSVEGLLDVNKTAFSEYSKVCVTEISGVITIVNCNNPPVGKLTWLKPPGKMCGAGTTLGTEFCPGIGDLNGATGFYFFGRTNDAVDNTLTDPEIIATFRPAFQIVCDGASLQNANSDAGGSCLANGTGSFALEVHTRYRSIFESFLTFGFNRLANANLAQYFYNPNGVGTSGVLVGAAGSELGPVESIANPIPSLKKIKDFRGCYRVDISPPDKIGEQVKTAVSSCN